MEQTRKELDNRLNAPINATSTKEQQRLKISQNQSLQDFVDKASGQVTKLRSDANNAQSSFRDCAEYFGEDVKMIDCNTFFGYFERFVATWKKAEEDNVKRHKQMLESQRKQQMEAKETIAANTNPANVKSALINELKTRNSRIIKFKPGPDEFKDGTFEDIILGMKSEPYRNPNNMAMEGVRKSFRSRRSGDPMTALTTNETEPL